MYEIHQFHETLVGPCIASLQLISLRTDCNTICSTLPKLIRLKCGYPVSQRLGIIPHFKWTNLKAVRHPSGTLINYIFTGLRSRQTIHMKCGQNHTEITPEFSGKQNNTEF